MKTPTVRMHLWLESGESVYFGMGRLMLLDMIEEHGSLRKAAEAIGMCDAIVEMILHLDDAAPEAPDEQPVS